MKIIRGKLEAATVVYAKGHDSIEWTRNRLEATVYTDEMAQAIADRVENEPTQSVFYLELIDP